MGYIVISLEPEERRYKGQIQISDRASKILETSTVVPYLKWPAKSDNIGTMP
uniref:Uncharacterized protein n=1 Tax=Triticum urartu TaxID=4572 RepID=A0A8R7UJI5_TRIUA